MVCDLSNEKLGKSDFEDQTPPLCDWETPNMHKEYNPFGLKGYINYTEREERKFGKQFLLACFGQCERLEIELSSRKIFCLYRN